MFFIAHRIIGLKKQKSRDEAVFFVVCVHRCYAVLFACSGGLTTVTLVTGVSIFWVGAEMIVETGVAGAATEEDVVVTGIGAEAVTEIVFDDGVAGREGEGDDFLTALETFSLSSPSGQKRTARMTITRMTIAMVGQWAFVNDQNDDACAVCGTVLAGVTTVEGVVGIAGVAGVDGADGVTAASGAEGDPALLFNAVDGLDEGVAAAIGAEAAVFPVAIEFAIATSVLCMPLSVVATACCWVALMLGFATSDAFN